MNAGTESAGLDGTAFEAFAGLVAGMGGKTPGGVAPDGVALVLGRSEGGKVPGRASALGEALAGPVGRWAASGDEYLVLAAVRDEAAVTSLRARTALLLASEALPRLARSRMRRRIAWSFGLCAGEDGRKAVEGALRVLAGLAP